MEHEIFVPFSATAVRNVLAEPERVARCVPGLQLESGGSAAAPHVKLRVRIGGSTVTYRGTGEWAVHGEGFAVEGEGTEARGDGAVRMTLVIVPRPVEDGSGTTLFYQGSVDGDGRIAGFTPRQRTAAARRLLDRFTAALLTELAEAETDANAGLGFELGEVPAPPAAGIGEPDDNERAIPGIPAPEGGAAEDLPAEAESAALFDAEIPPPALDPEAEAEAVEAVEAALGVEAAELGPEAGAARRTMIGRSTEEVDHAPPRGRYAPEPAPGSGLSATEVLRWTVPVAAFVLASVVLVTRALRRRR